MTRLTSAVILGNALGYSAWQIAWAMLPWLWGGADATDGLGGLMARTALTAIAFAAPPVLIGALGAWLARRSQPLVGLACGLWAVTLIGTVPAGYPIAGGVWYAPTLLVVLSGALGGWLIDLGEQARLSPPA